MRESSHTVNLLATAKVRRAGNDSRGSISHTVNMSSRSRPVEVLEDLRRTSGWYLAAWRDYRNITQQDLATEAGLKKSAVSELENGAVRKNGTAPRFNRTTIESIAKALSITEGMLFDVNPYTANPTWLRLQDKLRGLDESGQAMALRLIEALEAEHRKIG